MSIDAARTCRHNAQERALRQAAESPAMSRVITWASVEFARGCRSPFVATRTTARARAEQEHVVSTGRCVQNARSIGWASRIGRPFDSDGSLLWATRGGERSGAGRMQLGRNESELTRGALIEPSRRVPAHVATLRQQAAQAGDPAVPRAEPREPPPHASAIVRPIIAESLREIFVLVPRRKACGIDVSHDAGCCNPEGFR